MPRPRGSADLIADRRRRALALLDSGCSLNEVARRIGCSPTSVMRWRDTRRRRGEKVFQVRYSPGRPPKLNPTQKKRLTGLLLRGAMAHGYRTNLWTTARIAEVIQREFGIEYHPDHVGRLMHSLQWSSQMPERRALERDEQEVARWKEKDWLRIKKKPLGWMPI
jgi:transposase